MGLPPRWVAMTVFLFASALSFLDRQVLAALAPEIKAEFGLTNRDYGFLLSLFSITYAASAPLLGWFIDRAGLNLGISLSVAVWSVAGIATGFANTFSALMGCRAALGVAESGGIPANGKAVAMYLEPHERALGAAFGQIGISVGLVAAPVVAGTLAAAYGWRSAFVATGALGFLWIPIWLWTAHRIPARPVAADAPKPAIGPMLADPRLWTLILANMLAMTVYSLWINWTTVFLVDTHGLSQAEANRRLAWLPPLAAAIGGLTGGSISMAFVRRGVALLEARWRVCLIASLALLATAAAPHIPSPALATAAVCWSFFWSLAFSVNLYALPIDLFGPERAGLGVASLTFAYGLMQTLLSPVIGDWTARFGFGPVCAVIAVLPLAAAGLLIRVKRATPLPA
jgi:ACS family hexuronate transporter-like MFS transporter